jgi:hypothetical protein
VDFLSWNTEGDDRPATNLLRADTAITVDGGIAFAEAEKDGGFAIGHTGPTDNTFEGKPILRIPFDPRVSAVSVLPSRIADDGTFYLPAIVWAPGFGGMLVIGNGGPEDHVPSRLIGSRANKTLDWLIDAPGSARGFTTRLHFKPLFLKPPKGVADDDPRWRLARRAWLNQFQVSAKWGDPGNPFSAPAGVLANNVISDPVSCCLFMYADGALLTPELAPGISAMNFVGRTIDFWLGRMTSTGVIPGYWAYTDFLDGNPSVLIAAWDYAEATGDKQWLAKRIGQLEKAADYLASRDVDQDGLVEATQSGNANSLVQPARSCSAYDAIACGHKDAYCNALIYRAWRCTADFEAQLDRPEKSKRYTELADRLKAAYAKAFTVPDTGWIGWWRSQDGQLHDLASPIINGHAITMGLVDAGQGRTTLRKLRGKMESQKFTRIDLGLPMMLVPVKRSEYLQPDAPGLPKEEDGRDTFGWYLNGGVFPGDTLRYLTACYTVGEGPDRDFAAHIIDAMLARLPKGDVSTGGFATSIVDLYPNGGEFFTWDGKTCGYEGLCSHAYHFLQAVALRDDATRRRLYRPMLP